MEPSPPGGVSETAASQAIARELCAVLAACFSAFKSCCRIDLRSPAIAPCVALLREHPAGQSRDHVSSGCGSTAGDTRGEVLP